jgi:hypothetical protein
VPNATELSDEESIDTLNAGIDASTPWSNPSPRSIPGFNQECKDICAKVQQLRRRWQRTRLEDDYEAYRGMQQERPTYAEDPPQYSSTEVEEASLPNGLWKLVK